MALRWYLQQLRTHPLRTNISNAIVLMGAGDIIAQLIEDENCEEKLLLQRKTLRATADQLVALRTHTQPNQTPSLQGTKPAINFRRYGTLSPQKEKRLTETSHCRRRTTAIQNPTSCEPAIHAVDTNDTDDKTRDFLRAILDDLGSIDWFRNLTMVTWSAAIYTPCFVYLYRLLDRYVPSLPGKPTLVGVGVPVVASFVVSVPLTALFFCYGSIVHHVADWVGLLHEVRRRQPSSSWDSLFMTAPFDWDMAYSAVCVKLENELIQTVTTSAAIWVPINTLNFSLMPSHLRPVTLMFAATFWNCYLSLAQHRTERI